MTGHKNYRILRQRLEERVKSDPEARFRREERRRALRDALALAELRESRGQTQTDLARTLDVSQPNISQLERKEDLYVSTLRDYVEALGGRLEINAVFPDATISLAILKQRDPEGADPLDAV
jgi:transcriptional regulator with XRE-family HTH domain